VAPLLVFACGNPSRGDDALGPLFVERAARLAAPEEAGRQVEFLTDFQLQVEHALDLVDREEIVFVDATVTGASPYGWHRIGPVRDASFSSHVMSPSAVLQTYVDVRGAAPPPAWALTIRGTRFELGEPLSPEAGANLDAAIRFFARWLSGRRRRLAGEPPGPIAVL
jgi:hydrogenase maturation protease